MTPSAILETLNGAIDSIWAHLTPRTLQVLMAASIIGSFTYFQLTFPITVGDTDMWYHLADGRYIFDTGAIPRTFYYSFVDWQYTPGLHSWLFQLMIYVAHEAGRYWALLITRAALVILGVVLIVGLVQFAQDKVASRATALTLGLLALTITLIVFPKTYQLRPHLVSIICIASILLVFERRRLYWALPLIAVLWANLHGVEWIVGALIAVAYIAESLIGWRQDRSTGFPSSIIVPAMFAVLALMLNPAGFGLYLLPFELSPDYHKFVAEMRPVPIESLLSPGLFKLSIPKGAATSLTGVLSLVVWISLALGHRLRVSHALLSLAGLLLLSQGVRFFAEWALLSAPMLRSFVISVTPAAATRLPNEIWPKLAVTVWILAMPIIAMPDTRLDAPRLPFNQEGLPNGSASFLGSVTKTGKLFAPPNLAGFFAWKLYPKILIYSDMKHPDMASFYSLSTLRSPHALERTLQKYSPDFFAAELAATELGQRLREQVGFKPVFVDDIFVLYARAPDSSGLQPSVLQAIDPHKLAPIKDREEEGIVELQRLAGQDPFGRRVREALWRYYFDKQNYAAATRYAAEMLETYPEDPVAQFMTASIFEQTGRCPEALAIFAAIRPLLVAESQRVVKLHEGSCHYLTKDFNKANAAFEMGVNPYTDNVEPEYLFQYGFSAAATGNIPAAKRALEMLAFLVDPKNDELSKKAAALLEALQND